MDLTALIISIISIVFSFFTWFLNLHEDKAPNCNIKISHNIIHIENQKFVRLDVMIENLGTGNIKIKKARIFLNEGLVINNDIQFDNLRTHQKNCEDCDLLLHIQNSAHILYPDVSVGEKVRISKEIPALTDAIAYLYPKQIYETTMLFLLPKNTIYEATLVLVLETRYHNDCTCATHIINYL